MSVENSIATRAKSSGTDSQRLQPAVRGPGEIAQDRTNLLRSQAQAPSFEANGCSYHARKLNDQAAGAAAVRVLAEV